MSILLKRKKQCGKSTRMNFATKVEQILVDAERKLAEVTAEALQQRDYAAVQWVSAIAERIASSRLGESLRGAEARTRDAVADQPESTINPSAHLGSPAPTPRPSNSSDQFPHFHRDGDQLIKVGYSKSERKTYEHRSPSTVLTALVEYLAVFAIDGQLFTTERILAQFDRKRPAVPTYQIYLCLAFLIRRGLVKKNGRLGYTVDPNHASDFLAAAINAWNSLKGR